MSSLLVLLALLSLATLAARKGAVVEVVSGIGAPVLIIIGVIIGPQGLSYLGPSTVSGLAPAVDVGCVWLAFLIGVRAAAFDDGAARGSVGDVGRGIAAMTAALAVAALFFAVRMVAWWGEPLFADGVHLAALLPLAVAFVAVRVDLPLSSESPAEGTATSPPAPQGWSSFRGYARSVELLALAAAIGGFALAGELMAVVVIGLGLFAAVVVHLLARQGTIPPGVAALAALLLLTGFGRLAHVPAAVAGLVAGAGFMVAKGADGVTHTLRATERPMRIVVTVLLAAGATVDSAALAAGALIGVVVVLLHVALALIIGGLDASEPRISRLTRLASLPPSSMTPLIAAAAFSSASVPGAGVLLSVGLVVVAIHDLAVFALARVARRGAT